MTDKKKDRRGNSNQNLSLIPDDTILSRK